MEGIVNYEYSTELKELEFWSWVNQLMTSFLLSIQGFDDARECRKSRHS